MKGDFGQFFHEKEAALLGQPLFYDLPEILLFGQIVVPAFVLGNTRGIHFL